MRSRFRENLCNSLDVVFKLKYRGPRGSVYQKDYVEHDLGNQGPTWKNDFYSTFNNYKSVDYNTINRVHLLFSLMII